MPTRLSTLSIWRPTPDGWQEAVYENHPRTERAKGKLLQRRRAEVVERSFAHICTTGGSRRTWIRGMVEVGKRHLVSVMAHNLGVIQCKLIGVGKPRAWASAGTLLPAHAALCSAIVSCVIAAVRRIAEAADRIADRELQRHHDFSASPGAPCSSGC